MTAPLARALPTDRLPHVWQVAATMLLGGAIFSLAWALSEVGLLDLAATGVAFFVATLARQMGLSLTRRAPREFAKSAGMIDQIRSDFSSWLAGRTLLSHALLAVAATIVFLLLRAATRAVLLVIGSPWIALAAGLAVAAAVASPMLIRAISDTIAGRGGRADDDDEPKMTGETP